MGFDLQTMINELVYILARATPDAAMEAMEYIRKQEEYARDCGVLK